MLPSREATTSLILSLVHTIKRQMTFKHQLRFTFLKIPQAGIQTLHIEVFFKDGPFPASFSLFFSFLFNLQLVD